MLIYNYFGDNMTQQKKLMIEMTIFYLTILIFLGIIVTSEKLAPLNTKKIDIRLNEYIKENYKEIEKEINIGKTTYEKTKFKLKVTNKENKNLYFFLYYQNKNIKSTYKTDYLEGKTLLNKTEKKLTFDINNITKETYEVRINNTLNNFTKYTKDKIIKEENLIDSKIYTISKKITVENFDSNIITNKIIEIKNNLEKNNILPNNFDITIISKNNLKEIKISNITPELIKNNDLNLVISDIINKKKSDILKTYDITYKYLD